MFDRTDSSRSNSLWDLGVAADLAAGFGGDLDLPSDLKAV